jgi:arylsulfatase A-like enzyme
MRGRGAIAVLAVAIAACGWGSGSRKPNVIVVLLDTMRADRLGTYGAPRPTPFLDRLAAGSLVYDRAYAPSSWTVPSIASLFVAQYPSEHRVAVVNAVLPDDLVTLGEVLRDAGYVAGGFSANLEIAADNGFGQGFDRFEVVFHPPKDDAASLNRAALAWLDDVGSRQHPIFLYLQYMEPHSPYRFHDGITAADPPPPAEGDAALAARVNQGAFALKEGDSLPDAWRFTPAERARLAALYDGEVAYLDAQLAVLFAELDRRGVLANAIVVVTADHGEQLGEHGMYSHGNTLFEETIRVPLLVRVPGAPAARRAEPVGIAGVAPAILGELGIALPASFRVPSLSLRGDGAPTFAYSEVLKERPTYFRLHRRALVGRGDKLLVGNAGDEIFYDLAVDPGEEHPLPAPAFADGLRSALAEVTDGLAAAGAASPAAPIDAATRERLRVLGYTD